MKIRDYFFLLIFKPITEERIKPTSAPVCHGKRCKLGKCVPWEKVCDGIPDCRDEQDETIKMCQERTNKCKTNDTLCSNYHQCHLFLVFSAILTRGSWSVVCGLWTTIRYP